MSINRYAKARYAGVLFVLLGLSGGIYVLLDHGEDSEAPRSAIGEAHVAEGGGQAELRSAPELVEPGSPVEPGPIGSRAEVEPSVSVAEPVAGPASEEARDWEALLESIREAAETDTPHDSAWPSVQELTRVLEEEARSGESPLVFGALDGVLRAGAAEDEFVRAAVLLAMGMAMPAEEAELLANEFTQGAPGELARAAWFVLAVGQPVEDAQAGGVDLSLLTSLDSRSSVTVWPIEIARPEGQALLDLGLSQLSPPDLYNRARNADGLESPLPIVQGTATREVIVLTAFATRAQKPGLARNMLLGWMLGSDMSNACIWSLCYAARSDEGLAFILRDRLLSIGLDSHAGQYLAQQLGGLAGRGDLVFDMTRSELLDPSEDGGIREQFKDTQAVFALGEIIASGQEEFGARAVDLLIEVASSPSVIEAVRESALLQLAVARPDRIGAGIELILLSEVEGGTRKMAALLAKTVAVEDQARMRELLIQSYFRGAASSDVHEAYVRSLMALGGADAEAFLRTLPPADILDPKLAAKLELYLSK